MNGKAAWFMALAVSLCLSVQAFAENSIPTYRIGVFGFDSFLSKVDTYTGGGYAGEYLNRIASEEGIRFEYLEFPYEEITKAFEDGRYDLYVGIPHRNGPAANTILFSKKPMGENYVELLVPTEKNRYAFNDFEDYDGLRVGYLTGSVLYRGAVEILKKKNPRVTFIPIDGFSYDNAIENGQIDAIISSSTKYNKAYTCIARFSSDSLYFGCAKDRPELMELIDDAMFMIDLKDHDYFNILLSKYNAEEKTSTLFSQAERKYIQENPDINVFYSPNRGYLSSLRSDGYHGIEEDFTKEVAAIAGLNINVVEMQKGESTIEFVKNGKINVFPGLSYSPDWQKKTSMFASCPYLTLYHYAVRRNGDNKAIKRVAAIPGTDIVNAYVNREYAPEQIVNYETTVDCLKAVMDGSVDATFMTDYVVQYYLKQSDFRGLALSVIPYQSQICFGVPCTGNPLLADILTKCIQQIPEARKQEIIRDNTSYAPGKDSFKDLIYQNPLTATMILTIIITLAILSIVSILLVAVRNKEKKQLEQALETARKATAAKTDFLSRMSHDIRTPLNAIIGFLDIAKKEEDDKQALDDNLGKITYASNYLLGLINDILDMSKIENKKFELHNDVIDGPAFLKSISDMFSAQAEKKGITLKTDFSKAQVPWVCMDELRSRQVYSNLLNNALKFSDSGTTVSWTVVDTMVDENHFSMVSTITDQGCGMSKEFLAHIFQPFEQEHNSHSSTEGGTGLGLSIVKNLITLMGGTIEVESELGKGSTFTVRAKFECTTAPKQTPQALKAEPYHEGSLKGLYILLAEDHPLNREIAVRVLQREGMTVDTATNGEEAVDMYTKAEPHHYAAILMDVRMPVMDGLEATKVIRKSDSSIPIIAMTANAFDDDIRTCKEAGMTAHLSKPIDTALLYATLEHTIKNRQ